jgi:hypothetical protein
MPSTPRNRRVKAIKFRPELLERIERDAAARGESLSQWIEEAAGIRFALPRPRRAEDVEHRLPQPFVPGTASHGAI